MTIAEKRSERRVGSMGNVTLLAEGTGPVRAHIFDISPSGLGLGLEIPISLGPGTAVAIQGFGYAADGVVRYGYHMGRVFRVGVELRPVDAP
jgi:hypothetical protein